MKTVVYIYGRGSVNKALFGEELARKLEYTCFTCSGIAGIQNYSDEEVMIVTRVRPADYSVEDVKLLIDQFKENRNVFSKGKCEYLLINSGYGLEEFYREAAKVVTTEEEFRDLFDSCMFFKNNGITVHSKVTKDRLYANDEEGRKRAMEKLINFHDRTC